MDTHTRDRRRFHRIPIDGEVDLEFSGDIYNKCQIRNMSLGGMFVAGCCPDKMTEDCLVNFFRTARSDGTRFQAAAKVVWASEEGVGLQFLSMTQESYLLLRTTLINNAEQPSVIMHEIAKARPFVIANS